MKHDDSAAIERGRQWARYLDAGPPVPTIERVLAVNSAHLLAMGDSWFNHFPPFDVLVALRRKYGYTVHSVAVARALLADMAPPPGWDPANPPEQPASGRGEQLYRLLSLVKQLDPADKRAVKAVMVSGGGNDVAGDATVLSSLLNDAASGKPPIDDAAFHQLVEVDLRGVLAEVLSAATEIGKQHLNRTVPILIHGYAHPVPDGRAAVLGAWLRPVLTDKGYDLPAGTAIMEDLIDRLNLMQTDLLAGNPKELGHVTHVDLRPVLSNELTGRAYRADWQNELHPTIPAGFVKVADAMHAVLKSIA